MPDLQNADDIEKMIQSLGGVTVEVGGDSTWGLRDEDTEQVFDTVKLYGTIDFVRVATGKLSGTPSVNSTITVGGEALEVAHAFPERDGAWTRIYLADPDA